MKFEEYYRRYGMKTATRLKDPTFLSTSVFTLPYRSILFYLALDDIELGPVPSWSLINNTDRDIVVKHYSEKPFTDGARKVIFEHDKETRSYAAKYRRFTRLRNQTTALRNKSTILIGNSGTLRRGLTYQQSIYRTWQDNTNFIRNAFHNFIKEINDTTHYCFLPIPSPTRTFSRTEYGYITYQRDTVFNETFGTLEDLLHAHLFTFLSEAEAWVNNKEPENPDYTQSAFSTLPKEHADRIVLLFQVEDKVTMVTLEKLMELLSKEKLPTLMMFFNRIAEQRTEISLTEDEEAIVEVDDDGKLKIVTESEPVEPKKDKPVKKATTKKLKPEVEVVEIDAKEVDSDLPIDIKVKGKDQRILVKKIVDEGKKGNLSQREQTYLLKKIEQSNEVKMPGTSQTLVEFATIKPDDLLLVEPEPKIRHRMSPDADYSINTNQLLNEQYIEKLMERDMARCLLTFQRAGVTIGGLEKEERVDALSATNKYSVQLIPNKGAPSNFKYEFPIVKPNGRFKLNGTEAFYVPQRSDVPIRKIKPHVVKLTSYYGQNMIERGRLRANNYNHWLMDNVEQLAREKKINAKHREVRDLEGGHPYTFNLLGSKFATIEFKDVKLNFDPTQFEALYGKALVDRYHKDGHVILGKQGTNLLVLSPENQVTTIVNHKPTETVELEAILGIPTNKRKMDSVEIKIFSKYVPLGLVLGQRIGLTGLINLLGVKPRTFITGERGQQVADDEFALVFSDKTLVFSYRPRKAALILDSFNLAKKSLKQFNVGDMDNPDAYFSILEEMGLGLRYFIEIDTFFDLFVDPMTEDLLLEMGEPTNITELLVRAAELLVTNDSPKEIDARFMRERNYERFNGFMYKALVDGERVRRSRPAGNKAPIAIDPKKVLMDIQSDASKNLVETSNCARNMREKALITYSGEGGRTAQTMTPELRAYDPSELGHTSLDNTADSGKVAINATRSHHTLIKNLRGVSYAYDQDKHGPESLFTTTALMMPGTDRDELKRLNFVSTQYDSVYPTHHYIPMPLHTSMEYEVPYMVDEEFANMAKEDGKVLEITPYGMKVLYKSGSEAHVLLGRVYGKVAGITIPHELVTNLKVGQRFKADDALSWNSYYFSPSHLDKGRLDYKQAMIIPTLMQELPMTFEDSSSMWKGIKDKQKVDITYERFVEVDFTDDVKDIVKPGTIVDRDTPLLLRIPQHLQSETILNNEVTEALKELGVGAPKADTEGEVEKIEVFYYGMKDDMSSTLKTIANNSDRHFKTLREKHGRVLDGDNGMITTQATFNGVKLMPGKAMIKFYITKKELPTVSGNKTVNASNLKNTVTQYFDEEITIIGSEEVAHAYFSYNGQNNRVVFSPLVQGLGNRGLMLATVAGCKAYRGKQ